MDVLIGYVKPRSNPKTDYSADSVDCWVHGILCERLNCGTAGKESPERSELAALPAVGTTGLFGLVDFGGSKSQAKGGHSTYEQRSDVRRKECWSLRNGAPLPLPPDSMFIHRSNPLGI